MGSITSTPGLTVGFLVYKKVGLANCQLWRWGKLAEIETALNSYMLSSLSELDGWRHLGVKTWAKLTIDGINSQNLRLSKQHFRFGARYLDCEGLGVLWDQSSSIFYHNSTISRQITNSKLSCFRFSGFTSLLKELPRCLSFVSMYFFSFLFFFCCLLVTFIIWGNWCFLIFYFSLIMYELRRAWNWSSWEGRSCFTLLWTRSTLLFDFRTYPSEISFSVVAFGLKDFLALLFIYQFC